MTRVNQWYICMHTKHEHSTVSCLSTSCLLFRKVWPTSFGILGVYVTSSLGILFCFEVNNMSFLFFFYWTWCCLYIFNLRFWFQLSSYFIFHLYGRQTSQGPPHIRSEVKTCCSILTASSSLWEKLQLLLFLFLCFAVHVMI